MGDSEESYGIASTDINQYLEGVNLLTKEECRSHAIQVCRTVMNSYSTISVFMDPNKLKSIIDQVRVALVSQWELKPNLKNLPKPELEATLLNLSAAFMNRNVLNKISNDKTRAPSIGIHFGENDCCISVYDKGHGRIIPNKEDGGSLTTPNYISFNPDGSETFGLKAKKNAWKNHANTIYDLTRFIGREFNDPQLQEDMKSWAFVIQDDQGVPKILVNGKLLNTEQVLGKLLTYFRGMAERYLQLGSEAVKNATITVPATFTGPMRAAINAAGMLAGLNAQVLDKSAVSASAYFYEMTGCFTSPGNTLVFDFGSNSLVTTVLHNDRETILKFKEVTDIGWEFINKTMMDYCASRFKTVHGIDLFDGQDSIVTEEREDAKRRLMRLKLHCERAMVKLTTETTARVSIDGIMQGKDLNVEVTRETIDELNHSQFERSIRQVEETLREAGIGKDQLQGVVLAGSSSKIPKVQEMMEAFFGKKILKSIDPKFVAAHGAAHEAAWMNVTSVDLQDLNPAVNHPENPDIPISVVRELEVSNSKLFIANCDRQYDRLMEMDGNCPETVDELKDANKRTTDALLVYMRKNCAIGDAALQLDHERLLRAMTTKALERLQGDLPLNKLRSLQRERDNTMRKVTTEIIDQFKANMTAATGKWLRDHLTQDNIAEVKTIYDQLLTTVLGGGASKPTEKTLWAQFEEIIRKQCKETYTAYLDVVHERLIMFHGAIQAKFTTQSCFTKDELEECFHEEYDKVMKILIAGNSEICQWAKFGCDKLMGYYREQNNEIIQHEGALATKLTSDVVHFYDEEMKRYLSEGPYLPDQLKGIHLCLMDKLAEAFETAFKFTPTDKVCENVPAAVDALKEELGHRFTIYLQQNQTKSKMIDAELANTLESSKSSYVNLVDTMMRECPEGLDPTEFVMRHDQIVTETKEILKTEIRLKSGQERYLEANMTLLQTQIDAHWAYSSELNNLNWKRTKLTGGRGNDIPVRVEEPQKVPVHKVVETPKFPEPTGESKNEEPQINDVGDDSLVAAKRWLIEQSNKTKSQLDGGLVFTIKSGVVKNMFAKKIQDAIDCAQSPTSSKDDVEDKRVELVKWSSKYRK